jgi:hypothetical protein
MIIDGFMRRFGAERELAELPPDKLFESFAAYCIISRFYEAAFEPDALRTGGPGDLGVDAAGVIVNGALFTDPQSLKEAITAAGELNVHFVIVQARMNPTFSAGTFTMLASNLSHLFTDNPFNLPHSEQIARLRACIDAVYADVGLLNKGLPRLSVYYVAPGNPSPALEPARRHAEDHLQHTGWFDQVEVQPVGAQELRELYRRASSAVTATFTLTSHVALPPMPCIEQSYLGILSARQLVEKVLTSEQGQIRRSLFHDNVRDFMQFKNPVNARIQQTLRDDESRDRFAVMNNGITIVARALTVKGSEFQLRDFQIVNGCQTCYVLFFERSRLTDSTNISVRIIISDDRSAIADIVEATNRQTPVRSVDFDARDQFHVDIEDFFKVQPAARRLFYERRAGQFGATAAIADQVDAAIGQAGPEIPRTRVVTRAALARSFASAFLDEAWRPYYSTTMPEKTIFGSAREPLLFYTSASLLYRVEYLIRNHKIPALYAPTKFHLVAAVKYRLVGGGKIPGTISQRRETCATILDVVWDAARAEDLVGSLLPVLLEARNAESPEAVGFDYALLKNKRFGERVKSLIVGNDEG